MGLFSKIVSAAGGYKRIDELLEQTIFDAYQEFQHAGNWAELLRYPDEIIIDRCYEHVKRFLNENHIQYCDDMTLDETKQLKDLLNTILNTPEVVRTLRERSKTYGYEPMKLCGGIAGTWYLVDEKYDLYDQANEIDPKDVAYVRSLGFPI